MADVRKMQLSVFVGFLFLILLSIIFYLFRAAANGELIARWVLFLIFGTTAVILASFGIGYVILLITKTEEQPSSKPSSEISYRHTTQHPQPGTWIDIAQLPAYVAAHQKQERKQPPRRFVKRKRR